MKLYHYVFENNPNWDSEGLVFAIDETDIAWRLAEHYRSEEQVIISKDLKVNEIESFEQLNLLTDIFGIIGF